MSNEIESVVMGPTHHASNGLRFVEREILVVDGVARMGRILQQLFIPNDWTRHEEEWRDVPLSDA